MAAMQLECQLASSERFEKARNLFWNERPALTTEVLYDTLKSSAVDNSLRLDIWLDVACLFRTRSEAQKACVGGKVEVNGQNSKPHRLLRVGDQITLSRPLGRKQTLTVTGLAERHLPKAEARMLYNDTTPPLSEEEREMRRIERVYRASMQRSRAPDKRERRELRKLKGR